MTHRYTAKGITSVFTLTIHLQSDDLALLEPLVRHLGHIEVAIDAPVVAEPPPMPPRQVHPAVVAIDKLEHERQRKRKERLTQKLLSPKVIAAVACPSCHASVGRPCRSMSGAKTEFGRTGHTHYERRAAFKAVQS